MTFISQTTRSSSTPDIVIPNLTCDNTVIAGDWVRFNNFQVLVKAQADDFANSNVLGLVESVSGNKCAVRTSGVSSPLFMTLDVTKEYFLSDNNPGNMSLSVPTDPGTIVYKLGQPVDSQRFLVCKGLRMQRAV